MEPGNGSGASTGHFGSSTGFGAGAGAALGADVLGFVGFVVDGDRRARAESVGGRCASTVEVAHESPTSDVRKAAVATDKTR